MKLPGNREEDLSLLDIFCSVRTFFCVYVYISPIKVFNLNFFIGFREKKGGGRGKREEEGREGGRERNNDLLFHLFMHSLVASCICPDQGSNLQPWCIGTTLQPNELPSQGETLFFKMKSSGFKSKLQRISDSLNFY